MFDNTKRKLIEALEEMGANGQAMNDPAVHRICEISKALSNMATFEAMEERKRNEEYSGARQDGRSYADGMSHGNDWEHGGNYREQTSRAGRSSYNNGNSYGGREYEVQELQRKLEMMPRDEREQLMRNIQR